MLRLIDFVILVFFLHFSNLMDLKTEDFPEKWKIVKTRIFEYAKKKKNYRDIVGDDIDDLKILNVVTTHFKENLNMMLKRYPVSLLIFKMLIFKVYRKFSFISV